MSTVQGEPWRHTRRGWRRVGLRPRLIDALGLRSTDFITVQLDARGVRVRGVVTASHDRTERWRATFASDDQGRSLSIDHLQAPTDTVQPIAGFLEP